MAGSAIVWRLGLSASWTDWPNRRLLPRAFYPRPEKDKKGLSVIPAEAGLKYAIHGATEREPSAVAALQVEQVVSLGLQVCKDNRRYARIVGVPPKPTADDALLEFFRLTTELARKTTIVWSEA